MTTIRRVHLAPNYSEVEDKKELTRVMKEIQRFKPRVEVTLTGGTEIAKGRITEWHPARYFFAVTWDTKSKAFAAKTESSSDLQVFFKTQIFTTQLVFKTKTVRMLDEQTYHYRIPEQIFQQQRRGALRVPMQGLTSSARATFICTAGEFPILDLSVSGAKFEFESKKIKAGSILRSCSLKLGKQTITTPDFEARVTGTQGSFIGVKFLGLETEEKTKVKQFLIEALKNYFEARKK